VFLNLPALPGKTGALISNTFQQLLQRGAYSFHSGNPGPLEIVKGLGERSIDLMGYSIKESLADMFYHNQTKSRHWKKEAPILY
jgi:hypothetical protein